MLLEALRRGADARARSTRARRSTPGSCASCRRSRRTPTRRSRGERVVQVRRHLRRGVRRPSTPYFYSGWERARARHEVRRGDRPSVVILGAGPNRIGQGIEFDYCCVHAAMTVRASGRDAVMINCNPETVSTDYDTSDRLYFEPLTLEDVLGVVEIEQPEGVIVQFGGQTPLKLAAGLRGGRRAAARHERRRDRPGRGPRPLRRPARPPRLRGAALRHGALRRGGAAAAARTSATRCSSGRATCSAAGRWRSSTRADGLSRLPRAPRGHAGPARSSSTASWRTRSRSTSTRCATARTSGSAGSCSTSRRPAIHSGDCACVLPPHSLGPRDARPDPRADARHRARRSGSSGCSTSSTPSTTAGSSSSRPTRARRGRCRSSPRRSACRSPRWPAGSCSASAWTTSTCPPTRWTAAHVAVKEAVLPFDRFEGSDALLGPEMRSTGEVMGIAADFPAAFAKAQAAAGSPLPDERHRVHHGHRLRQAGRGARRPDLCTTRASGSSRRGGTSRGHPPDGRPVRAAEQDRRGLAARGRLDRARRRRPRRQHADRLGRAHRRLGDPPGRRGARHPVPDHAVRRPRRGARDRRAARVASPRSSPCRTSRDRRPRGPRGAPT